MMKRIIDGKAVILEGNERILVIADLHLGWHINLAQSTGAQFPSQDEVMLSEIHALINQHDIGNLYFLGDIKHSLGPDVSFNWQRIPQFMESLAERTKVTIVPGNHDGDLESLLPRDVSLCGIRGEKIEEGGFSVGLIHGHAWPSPEVLSADWILVGHNHPTLSNFRAVSSRTLYRTIRRRGRSIPVILRSQLDRNCVEKKGDLSMDESRTKGFLVTLPSFNKLISGIPVDSPESTFRGPFFDNGCANLPKSEVYSAQGTYLGTVRFLRERLVEMVK
ncbi:MAG: metallophosphoesterase [Candidatus Thorarchaeota archaeon]